MSKKRLQKGFTIAELLIATTIFSMVLMVILAAFMQVGRMFYKGISVNNTNEATRNMVDTIVGDVRLGSSPENTKTDSSGLKYFCVGSHRYTFKEGTQVKADQLASPNAKTIVAGVIQDTVAACAAPVSGPGDNARQLLGPDMQLNLMDFFCDAYNSCRVHAHVVFYGADNTVFVPSLTDGNASCSGNLLSTQFCAASDINTNVTLGY